MTSNNKKIWTRLVDHKKPYFQAGVLLRFTTIHTAGDFYKYALGIVFDQSTDLSFVGLDGRGWGYGRCTLPPEARYQSKEKTVSRDWLVANFIYIVEPEDIKDVWVCPKTWDFVRNCVQDS